MAEIDDEIVARALRWCAEAGRHASAAAVRDALAPLAWDELITARALLADPPPARPLGPLALADLARGALPDVAAERERQGQYRASGEAQPPGEPGAPRLPRKRAPARRGASAPVIRRVRDRVEQAPAAAPASPPRRPCLEALLEEEGRAVLERLIREHGARRAVMAGALAAGWQRADGSAPDEDDLARLLDAHRLAHGFERRERDEVRHALRAAGGLTARTAGALGVAPAALSGLVARLGLEDEAERLREARRAELRRRGTISERARLLLADEARLADLGLVTELEDDLRTRLPEHLRAVRAAATGSVPSAVAESLSVSPEELKALFGRLGIDLAGASSSQAPAGPSPAHGPVRGRGPDRKRDRERGRAPGRERGQRSTSTRTPTSPTSKRAPNRSSPSKQPRPPGARTPALRRPPR